MGKLPQAEALLHTVVRGRRLLHGSAHAKTIASMSELASMLKSQGKVQDAEVVYRDLLDAKRTLLGISLPVSISVSLCHVLLSLSCLSCLSLSLSLSLSLFSVLSLSTSL